MLRMLHIIVQVASYVEQWKKQEYQPPKTYPPQLRVFNKRNVSLPASSRSKLKIGLAYGSRSTLV